jgi:F-type H+-transporting ATPase subunit b
MAERAKRVQDSIDQSEKDKAQANALLARYKAQLEAAETEANAIILKAKEYAEADAERIIASGRASAEELLSNARKQLEIEQRAAMAAFRQDAAALVVAATSRLVEREIKSEDNRLYAAMLIEESVSLEPPFPMEPSFPAEKDKNV